MLAPLVSLWWHVTCAWFLPGPVWVCGVVPPPLTVCFLGRAEFFPRYDAPDPPSACFFFVVSGLSLGLESAELAARRKPAGPVLFRVWVFPPSDAFPSLFPSRGAVPIGFGLWCSVRVAWRGVATAAAALRVSHAPVVFRAGPGGLPLTDTCLPQGDLPLPGPCRCG